MQMIETTINIQRKALQRLCRASDVLRLPKRQVISWLLKRLADKGSIQPVSWSRVRYQKRDEKKNWEEDHLYLTPAEYELFMDLKKVYKMSGSYLVAYAVDKFIDEILQINRENTDNYRITCYGLSLRIVNSTLCWTQYWGIPPHMLQEPHPHP
jgi:hypothetical protein